MSKFTLFIIYSDSTELFRRCEYLLNKHHFEIIYKNKIETRKQNIIDLNNFGYQQLAIYGCLDLEGRNYFNDKLTDNVHVLKVLSKIRKIKHMDFVCYITRKEKIAWHTIKNISENLEIELHDISNNKTERYKTKYEIITQLKSSLTRSKLELIKFNGKLCVKKTFRDNALIYLKKELLCRSRLTHINISPIIEKGDNYIIIPYYENRINWNKNNLKLYPLDEARQIMTFMKWINSQGYALLDWNPGVAIFDKNQGLKFIDFEYFTETDYARGDFEKSVDFITIQTNDNFIDSHKKSTYAKTWYPILGVSYNDLMTKPINQLQFKRFIYLITNRTRYYLLKRFRFFVRRFVNIFLWKIKYKYNDKYLIYISNRSL